MAPAPDTFGSSRSLLAFAFVNNKEGTVDLALNLNVLVGMRRFYICWRGFAGGILSSRGRRQR
jgi:hypothetical protein